MGIHILKLYISMKVLIALFALMAVAMSAELNALNFRVLAAKTHYKNPWATNPSSPSCHGSREDVVTFDGLDDLAACMPTPIGADDKCFADYPVGNTAPPVANFVDHEGNTRCGLVCDGGPTVGSCEPHAECTTPPGTQIGLCMYRKPAKIYNIISIIN